MADHESPPSVVRSMVPFQPTINPLFSSVKCTPYKRLVVIAGMSVQVAPASVVLRMVPLSPVTKPVVSLMKCTLYNHEAVGGFTFAHVFPPSSERYKSPLPAAMKSRFSVTHSTSLGLLVTAGVHIFSHVSPPSMVRKTFFDAKITAMPRCSSRNEQPRTSLFVLMGVRYSHACE